MKNMHFCALLGGLLTSGFALADTPNYSYTIEVSENLIGKYALDDYGTYSGIEFLDYKVFNQKTTTTAKALSTFQESGKWYQRTEYTDTYGYDYSYQEATATRRDLSLIFQYPVTGEQFVDLTMTTDSPANYRVSVSARYGSDTSPRGFTRSISPSLGLVIDGSPSSVLGQSWGDQTDWSANATGVVNSSFEAILEAPKGGAINQVFATLLSDYIYGDFRSGHDSYVQSVRISDVELLAPPVPEPESYAMLLAGLGLMGAVARRRSKKSQ